MTNTIMAAGRHGRLRRFVQTPPACPDLGIWADPAALATELMQVLNYDMYECISVPGVPDDIVLSSGD